MKYTTLFALVAIIAVANCANAAAAITSCNNIAKVPGLSALCLAALVSTETSAS